MAGELRAIARDDDRAARDQRRLLNRLRADLIATFPAALAARRRRPGRPHHAAAAATLADPPQLAAATREELVAFARAGRHGWPDRFADQVTAALAGDHFIARDYLVRAKADTIRLAAAQLLVIGAQRRAWERRMGELLLGAPRPAAPASHGGPSRGRRPWRRGLPQLSRAR